jgi:hypothetical protein
MGNNSPQVRLTMETSPNRQDPYFQPIGPVIPLAMSSSTYRFPYRTVDAFSTIPIARWVRYRLKGASASSLAAMFRVRAVPARQAYFSPNQIPGCAFWQRSDLGFTYFGDGTSVTGLLDQSSAADPNQNLTAANSPVQGAANTSYNLQALLNFVASSSQYLTSGNWATPLQQPCTWIVVGHNSGAGTQYLLDANDATTGQQVQYDNASTAIIIAAGGSSFSATQSWASPGVLLAEFNGASSNIYFNNFTTPSASGTVAGGTPGSQGSMTLGSANHSLGGGSYWNGSVAEIIAYSGILTAAQKLRLKLYLIGRYAIPIT